MNRPPHTQNLPEPSVIPQEGWHCSHFYYSFDRVALQGFSDDELTILIEELDKDQSGDISVTEFTHLMKEYGKDHE